MSYLAETVDSRLHISRSNFESACQDPGVLAAISSKRFTPDISTPEKLVQEFLGGTGSFRYDDFGYAVGLVCQEISYSWICKCLAALAPFVPDGNWIEFVAEDHEYTRLYFKDGRMIEQKPVVTRVYPEVK